MFWKLELLRTFCKRGRIIVHSSEISNDVLELLRKLKINRSLNAAFYHLVIYISRFLFLRISCEQNITATLLTTVVEKGVEFRGFQGVRTLLDSLYTVLFTAAVSYVIVIHLLFESLEPEVLRL